MDGNPSRISPKLPVASVAPAARLVVRVRLRAEGLPAGLGTFRLVTFAASFHWMDRPVVARTVRVDVDPPGR